MEQSSLFAPRTKIAVPSISSPDIERPYQTTARESIFRQWKTVRSTLVVIFTGGGKTRIGGNVIKQIAREEPNARILWLAQKGFLLSQARESIGKAIGEYVSLEKAEWRSNDSRVVVGSVATLRGERLLSHAPDKFDYVFTDEAHHGPSPGHRAIYDRFPNAKMVGFTATPKRLDRIGQWVVWESVAFRKDIDEGIAEGYFCPVLPVSRFVDEIRLDNVATVAGDLSASDLEVEIAKSAGAIAAITAEEMEDRPTIIYCPGRASAHAVADALNAAKWGCAVSVDQNTPEKERERILKLFEDGTIQYIANCGIYTEGLDVPHARGIVIARPTKSEGLYIQMAGRGGRPEGWIGQLSTVEERIAAIAASGKPNFKLLDITGHAGRHSLVNAASALSGKDVPREVKDRAAEVLQRTKDKTLDQAVKMARKELADEASAAAARIAKMAAEAQIKSRSGTFDPFSRTEKKSEGIAPKWHGEPANDAEIEWLKENKLPTKNATKGDVEKFKNQAKEWRATGMANHKQRRVLQNAGQRTDLHFEVASSVIGIIAERCWWRGVSTPKGQDFINGIIRTGEARFGSE